MGATTSATTSAEQKARHRSFDRARQSSVCNRGPRTFARFLSCHLENAASGTLGDPTMWGNIWQTCTTVNDIRSQRIPAAKDLNQSCRSFRCRQKRLLLEINSLQKQRNTNPSVPSIVSLATKDSFQSPPT
eukprot:2332317-Rhodomonas_salina.1